MPAARKSNKVVYRYIIRENLPIPSLQAVRAQLSYVDKALQKIKPLFFSPRGLLSFNYIATENPAFQ
jgi:hypothetical protein